MKILELLNIATGAAMFLFTPWVLLQAFGALCVIASVCRLAVGTAN